VAAPFTEKPRRPAARFFASRWLWMLVFVVVIFFAMSVTTGGLSGQLTNSQAEYIENTIRRSSVQCFALEGRFPPSLQYLEQNYNLQIDSSRYGVYYEYVDANHPPQIRIITVK
jgi:hypothetical protein